MKANWLGDARIRRGWTALALSLLIVGVLGFALWLRTPQGTELRYSRTDLVTLRRLVDREPDNLVAWRQLGLRLAADGDALAEPALRQALALKPTDPEVATGLGELLLATGRYPEAFQVLRAAVEHNPNYPLARMALGRLYKRKASYLHAATQFEAVVALDRQWTDAWYELAICYLQMQQAAKAQEAMDEALRQSPREPHYLALKGSIDAAVGNVDAGMEASRRAAALAPRNVKIHSNLASMLLAHNRGPEDLKQAEQVIARLEQIAPQHPLLPYQRGELERLRHNWKDAATYLEKALVTAPGQDEAVFSLSQTYRRLNRGADAERMLAVYRRRQELRRRMNEVRIALGAQPNNAALYTRLANLQIAIGERAGAVSSLETALQLKPQSAEIQRRLRSLQAQTGASPGGRP